MKNILEMFKEWCVMRAQKSAQHKFKRAMKKVFGRVFTYDKGGMGFLWFHKDHVVMLSTQQTDLVLHMFYTLPYSPGQNRTVIYVDSLEDIVPQWIIHLSYQAESRAGKNHIYVIDCRAQQLQELHKQNIHYGGDYGPITNFFSVHYMQKVCNPFQFIPYSFCRSIAYA
jgi:hypothetical protein